MTTIILLLLGTGYALLISGAENVPLLQTVKDIWNGTTTVTGQTPTTGSIGPSSGGKTLNVKSAAITTTGYSPLAVGRAAGPSAQDAFRAAQVRAYIQSQR